MTVQPMTDAIWRQLNSDLRRFIRRRVSDDHVSDDLLQETFVRVHRNIGTLKEEDRLAAWVYQIARHVIHDHHRKATNATVALADVDPVDDCDNHMTQLRCRGAGWLNGGQVATRGFLLQTIIALLDLLAAHASYAAAQLPL